MFAVMDCLSATVSMRRVSVVVADDHPLIRAALRDAIKARPDLEFRGACATGAEALSRVRADAPDVLLLDMRLGDLDGLQVLRALVRDDISTRILFLSTFADRTTVTDAIAAGAAGYLDKTASPEQICDGIRAVARGDMVLSDSVEAAVLRQISVPGRKRVTRLSPRELEILRMVAAGLSAPQIAEQTHIARSTVKTHIQSVYQKLGVAGRGSAVAEAMRQGLVE